MGKRENEFLHSMAPPKITVLDGGFATQLTNHVGPVVDGDPLWSARFLATDPEAVVQTHLDFLRSEADVVITNTYQASVGGFVTHLGLDKKQSIALIGTAVDLARKACDIYMKEIQGDTVKSRPLIAGSVGPYGASLHDYSEYTGDYVDRVTKEEMREWHRPRIEALIQAGVDFLAIETIPARAEAEMLVQLLKEYPGIKAWLSFSCKDETHTSHGENFQEVAQQCWDMNPAQLMAVGVNCLNPKYVSTLFKDINSGREQNPIPLVAYPNSGEIYDPSRGGWVDGDMCDSINTFVQEWLSQGVKFVGGCCRTYDSDIRNIRTEVNKWLKSQSN